MVDYIKTARKIRKRILKDSYKAGACHIGSALSCVEILLAMFEVGREYDILFSKASGVATLYAMQEPREIAWKILKDNPLCWPGGSLGHGLPIAVGLAYAKKPKKVYVLISDAEIQEGTTWESLMFAAHHKLSNLCVVLDYNRLQACGKIEEILKLEDLRGKLRAFNCDIRIANGHSVESIKGALNYPPVRKNEPVFVIANTVKGYPIDFMSNQYEWHYKNLNKTLLNKALKQL